MRGRERGRNEGGREEGRVMESEKIKRWREGRKEGWRMGGKSGKGEIIGIRRRREPGRRGARYGMR